MKLFIKIIAIIVMLIAIAAVAAPFLIPPDMLRQAVLAQIISHTGRKVSIGKLSVSVFPDIGFTAHDVVVPEPEWTGGEDMVHIASVHLGIDLPPLLHLHPQVQVKDITLESPVIRLVKRGSRVNWQFSPAAAGAEPRSAAQTASRRAGGVSVNTIALDKIVIHNGTVTYDDGSPSPMTIGNLNLKVEALHLNERVDVKASGQYDGQAVDTAFTLQNPLALTSGKALPVELTCRIPNLLFYWKGTLALAAGNLPVLRGTLDIPELDTAKLKGAPAPQAGAAQGAATTPPPAAPAGPAPRWSDAPFHIEALSNVDADIRMTIDKLTLPQTSLQNVVFSLRIASGGMQVTAPKLDAYDGTLSATFYITPSYKAGFSAAVADVKAQPLLHDFAGYDKLSGTLAGHINVSAQGKSERQMIAALAGNGDFHFKDGVYSGANLLSLVRSTVSGAKAAGTTDFSDLSGSYTIQKGIVTNSDLKLISQLLHVSGAGTMDLPQWQVNYLLKPQMVGAQASGGAGPGGITVPVEVSGSLDKPQFKADIQAAITENLKDPAALKSNLKAIRQNLLNNGSGGTTDIKNNLKNLLKSF